MILLCRCSQKMRKNGERHILERDGRAVEQLQMICIPHFHKGSDYFCIKLGVICAVNAVL